MTVKKFFAAISASIDKSRINEHVENQMNILEKSTMLMVSIDDNLVSSTSQYKAVDKALADTVKGYRGKPMLFLRNLVEKRISERAKLLAIVDKSFGKKLHKESMDYRHLNIIEFITMIDWFITFTHAFTPSMIKSLSDNPYDVIDKDNAAIFETSGNLRAYAIICNALSMDFKDMIVAMKELEGITFDPEMADINSRAYGARKVDPVGMGLLPVSLNPAYWLGQIYNIIYIKRLEAAREDVLKLQMEVHYLNQSKEGVDEAALEEIQETISYHSNRLNRLRAFIEDAENDD